MRQKILNYLKINLSDERFNHTINVANKAVELAKIYRADIEKCEMSALLHDVAKEMDSSLLLQYIKKNAIILKCLCDIDIKSLLHSIAGSILIQTEFNIADIDIINAVRYHTSARKDMSLIEKIVFVSDKISNDRNYKNVCSLRALASHDLDQCLFEMIHYSILSLLNKKMPISVNTVQAYNQLVIGCKKVI